MMEQLQQILTYVKQQFVDKDTIVDLLGVALVTQDNVFLLGYSSTLKSAFFAEVRNTNATPPP